MLHVCVCAYVVFPFQYGHFRPRPRTFRRRLSNMAILGLEFRDFEILTLRGIKSLIVLFLGQLRSRYICAHMWLRPSKRAILGRVVAH